MDDIDLYPAAVSERVVPGGTVGPTFSCILGRQFRNSKVGDRFWYERGDRVVGFTQGTQHINCRPCIYTCTVFRFFIKERVVDSYSSKTNSTLSFILTIY